MKNIIMVTKQFIPFLIRKFGRTALVVSLVLFFMAVIFTSLSIVKAYTETDYKTTITFDQNQMNPLVLNSPKTEIQPGLSYANMDKLNRGDPEAIKAYIQQESVEHNIDWKLVYAIGAYESGYFKSNLAQSKNNYFGRKATSSTWMSFETPQEGIDNQFEYLKTRYIDKGMDSPAEMNRVYCEGNTWQYKVQSIMDSV